MMDVYDVLRPFKDWPGVSQAVFDLAHPAEGTTLLIHVPPSMLDPTLLMETGQLRKRTPEDGDAPLQPETTPLRLIV